MGSKIYFDCRKFVIFLFIICIPYYIFFLKFSYFLITVHTINKTYVNMSTSSTSLRSLEALNQDKSKSNYRMKYHRKPFEIINDLIERHMKESARGKDKIRESAKGKDEIKESARGKDEIRESAKGKDEIKESARGKDEIRESAKGKDEIKESKWGKYEIKESERGKYEIKESERDKDEIKQSKRGKDVMKQSKREKDEINKAYFSHSRNVPYVNCKSMFENEVTLDSTLYQIFTNGTRKLTPQNYTENTRNCSSFIANRGYITHYLTEEERNFPIAYSILMYKDPEQAERLLRAIYRPQNSYCIHVDAKTNDVIYDAMKNISHCLKNVFVLKERVKVVWGKMSVLEPELLCMRELLTRNKRWKYFINLTGQEFPLKTNYELVKILKAYNGSNDVETSIREFTTRCVNKTSAPHKIHVTKGAVHVAVSRGFVEYAIYDQRAHDILTWMNKSCYIPDEAFFTTLNHNPHLGVPGAYKGYPETTRMSNTRKPYLARFKNRQRMSIYHFICRGKWVRGMCVYSHKDLPFLNSRRELFANKFHLYTFPVAYGCLEELIFNRTRDEFQGKRTFGARWYSSFDFVKNKVE